MNFTLEKTLPLPMIELDTSGSEVWEADLFIFNQGETYLVEAESGKGKTTLLSMLYGLRKDFSGNVSLDQKNLAEISSREWAELRKTEMSYIFQGLELFDELSAIDNIQLKNRMTSHKSNGEIIEMATALEMDNFLEKKCGILSFGQKQRIAIIRALCQPFHFLFADESFSHIDARNSETALNLILSECEENNAGLIMTSLGNQEKANLDNHVKL